MSETIINGYRLLQDWTTSGSARWSYAEKNGRQWFIKQFMAPKYKRVEDGISPERVEKARIRCEEFRRRREELYQRIRLSDSGNIVAVTDFFCCDSRFYAVSERVEVSAMDAEEISRMEPSRRLVVMKALTYILNSLHKVGVVHADLKPDNVLFNRTPTGHAMKLIDFDSSFLESSPLRGGQLSFDLSFVAPETLMAYDDPSISLTTKIDIFALGLMLHLYYSGRMPGVPESFSSAGSAVMEGSLIRIDSSLPDWLRRLITKMTSRDPEERPCAQEVFAALNRQEYLPGEEIPEETVPETPIRTVPRKLFHPPARFPRE